MQIAKIPYVSYDRDKKRHFVRLNMPVDVQPILGAKPFLFKFRQSINRETANDLSVDIVRGWKADIARARMRITSPLGQGFILVAAEMPLKFSRRNRDHGGQAPATRTLREIRMIRACTTGDGQRGLQRYRFRSNHFPRPLAGLDLAIHVFVLSRCRQRRGPVGQARGRGNILDAST
jgi:hypothetical protein